MGAEKGRKIRRKGAENMKKIDRKCESTGVRKCGIRTENDGKWAEILE